MREGRSSRRRLSSDHGETSSSSRDERSRVAASDAGSRPLRSWRRQVKADAGRRGRRPGACCAGTTVMPVPCSSITSIRLRRPSRSAQNGVTRAIARARRGGREVRAAVRELPRRGRGGHRRPAGTVEAAVGLRVALGLHDLLIRGSSIWQMRSAVNREVVGSSPTPGALAGGDRGSHPAVRVQPLHQLRAPLRAVVLAAPRRDLRRPRRRTGGRPASAGPRPAATRGPSSRHGSISPAPAHATRAPFSAMSPDRRAAEHRHARAERPRHRPVPAVADDQRRPAGITCE